jgi:threonine aldolase
MLCGTDKFIAEARRIRKMLGGGMRQAGVLAAAGIYALEHNIERLKNDHKNAQLIARTLAEVPWAEVDITTVETNILYFSTGSRKAENVVSALAKRGILSGAAGPHTIRFVTHLGISEEDTKEICTLLKKISITK